MFSFRCAFPVGKKDFNHISEPIKVADVSKIVIYKNEKKETTTQFIAYCHLLMVYLYNGNISEHHKQRTHLQPCKKCLPRNNYLGFFFCRPTSGRVSRAL